MPSTASTPGFSVDVHLRKRDVRAALERDVRAGLTAEPKSIPPTWFYDEEGSKLFEEITQLDEYYLTRAELGLIERHAAAIASGAGAESLVELGAGSCDKTRPLLDALAAHGDLVEYVPFDVSADFLEDAARAIAREYGGLAVHAVVGDFLRHLDRIPSGRRRLVAFLGSTVGNLTPAQRSRFFGALAQTMGPADHFLLGTDVVKDVDRILAAYDDGAGVTGRFNRNVLHVLNRELDADFVPERFEHVARWNAEAQWVEMRLRSDCDHLVHIDALELDVPFAQGEEVLTEISAKFSPAGIAAELDEAGFVVDHQWGGSGGEFLLTLARLRP